MIIQKFKNQYKFKNCGIVDIVKDFHDLYSKNYLLFEINVASEDTWINTRGSFFHNYR